MTHVHTTWYRLVDGTQANPNDVVRDEQGVLRHKSGVAVALRDSGVPRTSAARQAEVVKPSARETPPVDDREMKPASSGRGYRTRAAKSE